mmetsp:Transcript_17866/g.26923  ORF Transcript_17866/g.26923 Transcript_17866/m.26923 type:complete len:261 (+) Transcript_17866:201-983(+)
MHMLRSVLQITVTTILILGRKDWNALEAPPTNAKNEGIIALENLLVPTMFLEPASYQAALRFLRSQSTYNKRHGGVKAINKLGWDAINSHAAVNSLTETLKSEAAALSIDTELLFIAFQPSLFLALECLNIFIFCLLIAGLSHVSFLAFVIVIIKSCFLSSLFLCVELSELSIRHASCCFVFIVITVFKYFPIWSILFTSFKILKVVKFLCPTLFTITVSTPIASHKFISYRFNEAVLSFFQPRFNSKRNTWRSTGHLPR